MPRQLRIEYAGAIYHLMSRGDRREAIFLDDKDRKRFLDTLGEVCGKSGWQVHAYCLMRNHFHLVVETPTPNLVAGMKWFLGTYTARFNAKHHYRGHVFAGRYKSVLVDDADALYLRVVCDYVHLNPWRAGLITEGNGLETFPWSSFPLYLVESKKRPPWLRVDRYLGEYGILKDNAKGRRQLSTELALRCVERGTHAEEELWKSIRTGWQFGAADFVERVKDQMGELTVDRGSVLAEVAREHDEVRGKKMLSELIKKEKLKVDDLQKLKKADPRKIRIAMRLREQTTLGMKWIANELAAGTPSTLWNAIAKYNQYDNSRD